MATALYYNGKPPNPNFHKTRWPKYTLLEYLQIHYKNLARFLRGFQRGRAQLLAPLGQLAQGRTAPCILFRARSAPLLLITILIFHSVFPLLALYFLKSPMICCGPPGCSFHSLLLFSFCFQPLSLSFVGTVSRQTSQQKSRNLLKRCLLYYVFTAVSPHRSVGSCS